MYPGKLLSERMRVDKLMTIQSICLIGLNLYGQRTNTTFTRRVESTVGPSCCQYDICHIVAAAEELTMNQLTQKDVRAFHACARHCDRAVIILKGKKRVQWMTEPARHCVAEFFGDLPHEADRLPAPLERWIKQRSVARRNNEAAFRSSTVIERNGEELVVRLVTDKQEGIQHVRLEKQRPVLSARSLERLGLSRRETEVLFCVAQGKTNAEVGGILGLSRFTVRKHLEHVYEKLGVQTRTAAAALAYAVSLKPGIGELPSN
jgi:DNA-binding CsgD family transcriptional regulator